MSQNSIACAFERSDASLGMASLRRSSTFFRGVCEVFLLPSLIILFAKQQDLMLAAEACILFMALIAPACVLAGLQDARRQIVYGFPRRLVFDNDRVVVTTPTRSFEVLLETCQWGFSTVRCDSQAELLGPATLRRAALCLVFPACVVTEGEDGFEVIAVACDSRVLRALGTTVASSGAQPFEPKPRSNIWFRAPPYRVVLVARSFLLAITIAALLAWTTSMFAGERHWTICVFLNSFLGVFIFAVVLFQRISGTRLVELPPRYWCLACGLIFLQASFMHASYARFGLRAFAVSMALHFGSGMLFGAGLAKVVDTQD